MSKNKEKVSETLEQETPEYNKKAYTVFQKDNNWHFAEVQFDSNLMVAGGDVKVLYTNANRFEVEERFKIRMAEDLFE